MTFREVTKRNVGTDRIVSSDKVADFMKFRSHAGVCYRMVYHGCDGRAEGNVGELHNDGEEGDQD